MNVKRLGFVFGLTILLGCQPEVYKCCRDGKEIKNLENACILRVNIVEKSLLSSRIDEQYYEFVTLNEIKKKENAPIDDIAFAYKEELFCNNKCAEIERNIRNLEVEKRRLKRRQIEIGDSLFLDSLQRGLK